jgi:hypothetical protein
MSTNNCGIWLLTQIKKTYKWKENSNLLNYSTCQLLMYQSGDRYSLGALALQGVFGFG